MSLLSSRVRYGLVLTSCLLCLSAARAQAPDKKPEQKYPPFAEAMKDATPIEGLIKLYRKESQLFAEIGPGQLNQDFIILVSIARGIGERPLLGGYSWGDGDDGVWQFRLVEGRVQIVRRNVRFRAAKGSPQERAVRLAYTDSVLFSLPVVTTGPGGGNIVDVTPVFMSDLPQISHILPGFGFARDRSSWAAVKGLKDNVEIEVAATYASAGMASFDTVPDSRGVTINVHYSISRLPETGYQPRMADDRVGHFLTVVKDYTKDTGPDRFVRYINRWDLRKAEPTAEVSPPVKPIIFWLEKTIPFKYRAPIREGILEWNKAFEKAGFVNAIEVRQQPDEADWDPEDVNYNTIRWMTASAGFAMGPSRVNPINGQILDADIIFDADFVQHWRENYDIIAPKGARTERAESGAVPLLSARQGATVPFLTEQTGENSLPAPFCECARGMSQQLALAAIALEGEAKPIPPEQLEKLIMQGIKSIAVHEVGHTLGLRHNFKSSAFYTLEELNDVEKTRSTGIAASVMDYLPVNIVPKGQKQGDYFDTTVGPYDLWVIEYGYKPIAGNEEAELNKIAARVAEPALQYGTDEDTQGSDPDPLSNRYDLGKDPVAFARQRVQLVAQAMPDLVDRVVKPGESYHEARRAFSVLLAEHGRVMYFVARFIGGMYVYRDHKGDPNARPPYVVAELAKQREALQLLEEQVFGPESYQFPPALYNYLGQSNWSHWGSAGGPRADYPIHDVILSWQERVLGQLLSSATLRRLIDAELRLPADQETFTAAELLQRLTAAVFRETEKLQEGNFTNRKPAINPLRRALQRRYFQSLADLAMGRAFAPQDCQTVAFVELEALEGRLKQVLAGKAQLDPYTRAHLSETATRIRKVLDARLDLRGP